MNELNIDWNDVGRKEAHGLDNVDLGEVQGLALGFVVTKRGLISAHEYYFPLVPVDRFNGKTFP